MNFLTLMYFVEATKEKNFTKTASRLHITQQSLSEHIAKLEDEYDVCLFERKKPLQLTYAGNLLLEKAEQILDLKNQIDTSMKLINSNKIGDLKIGILYNSNDFLNEKIFHQFQKLHPEIDIKLFENNNMSPIFELLNESKVDVILDFVADSYKKSNGYKYKIIREDQLALLIPKKIIEQYSVSLFKSSSDKYNFHSIQNCPFIFPATGYTFRSIIDSFLEKNKLHPKVCYETTGFKQAFDLCCLGNGISIFPKHLAERYLGKSNFKEEIKLVFISDSYVANALYWKDKEMIKWELQMFIDEIDVDDFGG